MLLPYCAYHSARSRRAGRRLIGFTVIIVALCQAFGIADAAADTSKTEQAAPKTARKRALSVLGAPGKPAANPAAIVNVQPLDLAVLGPSEFGDWEHRATSVGE